MLKINGKIFVIGFLIGMALCGLGTMVVMYLKGRYYPASLALIEFLLAAYFLYDIHEGFIKDIKTYYNRKEGSAL